MKKNKTVGFLVMLAAACVVVEDEDVDPRLAADDEVDAADELAGEPITTADSHLDSTRLHALAEHYSEMLWPDGERIRGNMVIGADAMVYLAGPADAVASAIEGLEPETPVAGLVMSTAGACLATVSSVPTLPSSARDGVDQWLDALRDAGADVAACPRVSLSEGDLSDLAAQLTDEARALQLPDAIDDILAQPDVATACGVACADDDNLSYAGQEAYSNGADTGLAAGCTFANCSCGGTGTYGYQYQCVEFTERVHQHSDWAGNAHPGYWTQTGLSSGSASQGPYWKSLLPLGNGTNYAAPQAGDIVTWSKAGTVGHVAVISNVNAAAGTITVLDQNRACGDQSCLLTYSNVGGIHTLGNGAGAGYCGAEGMGTFTLAGYLHRGWDFGQLYGLAADAASAASTNNWWPNDCPYHSGTTSGSVTDITDYITVNPGTVEPYLASDTGLKLPTNTSFAHGYRYFRVYIKSNCVNKTAAFYWKRTTDVGFSETRKVTANIVGSGWQSLLFDPSVSPNWNGTIDQVRLDPASTCAADASDLVSIQSAYFYK